MMQRRPNTDWRSLPLLVASFQYLHIRFGVGARSRRRPTPGLSDSPTHLTGDVIGNLRFERRKIFDFQVILFAPQLCVVRNPHQLDAYD